MPFTKRRKCRVDSRSTGQGFDKPTGTKPCPVESLRSKSSTHAHPPLTLQKLDEAGRPAAAVWARKEKLTPSLPTPHRVTILRAHAPSKERRAFLSFRAVAAQARQLAAFDTAFGDTVLKISHFIRHGRRQTPAVEYPRGS